MIPVCQEHAMRARMVTRRTLVSTRGSHSNEALTESSAYRVLNSEFCSEPPHVGCYDFEKNLQFPQSMDFASFGSSLASSSSFAVHHQAVSREPMGTRPNAGADLLHLGGALKDSDTKARCGRASDSSSESTDTGANDDNLRLCRHDHEPIPGEKAHAISSLRVRV